MRRSRRASTRAGSSTTPPRPTLTKMQLAGRRSMVARSTSPAVCSVMGRLTTMASAWPASSARRWGPWTSSTHSGGGPSVRRNPTVRMPSALPSRATSRPISPSPSRNRVWPDSSRNGRRTSGQALARWSSISRGSSLAMASSPRMANSASGHRVDAAGGGDDDPLQGLGRQPGLAHLLARPGAGGVDPAQPGQPVDHLGQALGGVARGRRTAPRPGPAGPASGPRPRRPGQRTGRRGGRPGSGPAGAGRARTAPRPAGRRPGSGPPARPPAARRSAPGYGSWRLRPPVRRAGRRRWRCCPGRPGGTG